MSEWKSAPCPISSAFSPQLLSDPNLGPLFFKPIPNTLTHLSSSTENHNFGTNCLQLLPCPGNNTVLVFFPTGEYSDQVGFVELIVKNSNLCVRVDEDSGGGGDVCVSKKKFNHRILKILVNPVEGNSKTVFGYVLVCTLYSVHWFSVKMEGLVGPEIGYRPGLVYLYGKVFKSCAVVNACWNPHLPEESVVMLENGELFLFDVDSFSNNKNLGFDAKYRGTMLRVTFDNLGVPEKRKWLGCHFSWHPRTLIVACSVAVFLVDLRLGDCKVSCLAKSEMSCKNGLVENNNFIAFSKAGPDGYYFTVASNHLLFLYDIRKPMTPVLQWNHVLDNPCYVDVFSLSELRSHSRDDKYNWASESGFCILMGSFWNCEFCLFCYGPSLPALRGSVSSIISKFHKSLYAWELPSELSLSDRDCHCRSCLTREEFLKDSLPVWTDWHRKKETILGFGILDKNMSSIFSEPDKFGGFTLIRFMSSGKLESQRFCASWDCATESEEAHKNLSMLTGNYYQYFMGCEEYKFPRRFKYLELDYLNAFLNGNIFSVLGSIIRKPCKGPKEKVKFHVNSHELLCEKLKACRIIHSRLSTAISNVLKDTSLSTSIHELAVRRMWAGLPMDLLQLAFSCYSELLDVVVDKKKMSLEFLAVPDQPQLPPFFLRKPSGRSNKWSHKVQRGNHLVGPVIPLPILLTLHDIRDNGCLSFPDANIYRFETELTIHCNEVKRIASEMAVIDSGSDFQNDLVVSLADDKEEPWGGSKKSKHFFLNNQFAFSDKSSHGDPSGDNSDYIDERFATLISKLHTNDPKGRTEMVGLELFDDLCLVELKFDGENMKFRPKELKALKLLKRQFSRWQEDFDLFPYFCNRSKLQKEVK